MAGPTPFLLLRWAPRPGLPAALAAEALADLEWLSQQAACMRMVRRSLLEAFAPELLQAPALLLLIIAVIIAVIITVVITIVIASTTGSRFHYDYYYSYFYSYYHYHYYHCYYYSK